MSDTKVMQENFKRPESILVVIYTLGGEVLMLNRTRPKGFWQSVTGSLEWGETAKQAAERELFEETGLAASGCLIDCQQKVRFPIINPWRTRYARGVFYNCEHCFVLPLPTRRTIRLNPKEHSQHRWLPKEVAAQRASSWTNRDAILRWLP